MSMAHLQSSRHIGDEPESDLERFFLSTCICTRIWHFFVMREQWLELFYFNAVCHRSERCLLLIIDLTMNFCMVALWFNASSKAYKAEDHLDWRKVEGCAPLDFRTSILIGVIFCF